MKAIKLGKEFFERDAKTVARDLLGKVLIRNLNGKLLKGRIVETEAYFGSKDPASRAVKNGDLRETMLMSPGTILVYGIHNNWMLNFVTKKEGEAEAVLVRALEPLNFKIKCSGPGLLTKALEINKEIHKRDVDNEENMWIEDSENNLEIVEAFRVGVKKDLPIKLRFYVKDNKHISKK